MFTSGHSSCKAIGESLAGPLSLVVATSLFSSTHYPSVHPSIDKLRKAVVIATGRPPCPWGSFLDRIPLCHLSLKGRSLCWMVVYLCRLASISVPQLNSSLRLLFSWTKKTEEDVFLCFWFSNSYIFLYTAAAQFQLYFNIIIWSWYVQKHYWQINYRLFVTRIIILSLCWGHKSWYLRGVAKE